MAAHRPLPIRQLPAVVMCHCKSHAGPEARSHHREELGIEPICRELAPGSLAPRLPPTNRLPVLPILEGVLPALAAMTR